MSGVEVSLVLGEVGVGGLGMMVTSFGIMGIRDKMTEHGQTIGRLRRELRRNYGTELLRADVKALAKTGTAEIELEGERIVLRLDRQQADTTRGAKLLLRAGNKSYIPFPALMDVPVLNPSRKQQLQAALDAEAKGKRVKAPTVQQDDIAELTAKLNAYEAMIASEGESLPAFYRPGSDQVVAMLREVLPDMNERIFTIEQKLTIEQIITEYLPALHETTLGIAPRLAAAKRLPAIVDEIARQLDLLYQAAKNIHDTKYERLISSIQTQGRVLDEKFPVADRGIRLERA